MRGEIDINDASRPIKSKEADACAEIGIDFVELSVAYDGLAVLVNPENDWVDYFTVEELEKIWNPDAQGKVMYWNQVREGWPNEELRLFGPGTASEHMTISQKLFVVKRLEPEETILHLKMTMY